MRVPLFTICEHMGYSRLYVVYQSKARETLLSLFYIPISLLPPISIDFHFLIRVCIGQRGDKLSIGKLKTSPPKPLWLEKEEIISHDLSALRQVSWSSLVHNHHNQAGEHQRSQLENFNCNICWSVSSSEIVRKVVLYSV